MKFVLNKTYGGYGFSKKFKEAFPQCYDLPRNSEELVEAIQKFGIKKVSGEYASIVIVKVPDGITDWDITEYDGDETLIYVLDGKINYA